MIDKRIINKKLEDICEIVSSLYGRQYNLGVLNGVSGLSLFQFYYARYVDQEAPAALGTQTIVNCVDRINRGYGYPTFCNGLAGIGWAFDHLHQEGFIELDMDAMFSPLDDYIYKRMCEDVSDNNYDFLHGAIGYGLYFLKRYRNSTSEVLKRKYHRYIFELVNFLERTAEADGDSFKWKTAQAIDPKEHGYNLSLSHGIAGIINFLSRLYYFEDFRPKVKPLIEGGARYILRFQNQDEGAFALFPSRVTLDSEINYRSRLAWCYGDLGIGVSLWHVSNALHDIWLKDTAIKVLRHASKRRNAEQSMVRDAGICHGAYGIAQVFNKIHRKTNDPDLHEAAQYWMEEGLKMAFHDDGFAGYRKFRMLDNKESWDNDLCLLEGISGIGLVMIDHLSEAESTWDECLLIS
ncbi:MAG: lanthionine synthetase C family protein [Bacteroidota bacterium]